MKDLIPVLTGLLGFLIILTVVSAAPFLVIYAIYSLVVWQFSLLVTLTATFICSTIVGLLLIALSSFKLKRKE